MASKSLVRHNQSLTSRCQLHLSYHYDDSENTYPKVNPKGLLKFQDAWLLLAIKFWIVYH